MTDWLNELLRIRILTLIFWVVRSVNCQGEDLQICRLCWRISGLTATNEITITWSIGLCRRKASFLLLLLLLTAIAITEKHRVSAVLHTNLIERKLLSPSSLICHSAYFCITFSVYITQRERDTGSRIHRAPVHTFFHFIVLIDVSTYCTSVFVIQFLMGFRCELHVF